jgi:hypothetical protein
MEMEINKILQRLDRLEDEMHARFDMLHRLLMNQETFQGKKEQDLNPTDHTLLSKRFKAFANEHIETGEPYFLLGRKQLKDAFLGYLKRRHSEEEVPSNTTILDRIFEEHFECPASSRSRTGLTPAQYQRLTLVKPKEGVLKTLRVSSGWAHRALKGFPSVATRTSRASRNKAISSPSSLPMTDLNKAPVDLEAPVLLDVLSEKGQKLIKKFFEMTQSKHLALQDLFDPDFLHLRIPQEFGPSGLKMELFTTFRILFEHHLSQEPSLMDKFQSDIQRAQITYDKLG